MKRRITFVTTTINIPFFIEGYLETARMGGYNNVKFIVVGDLKTPLEVREYCNKLGDKYQYPCLYMGIEDQIRWLDRFKELKMLLPYNSLQRRNIGFLKAYEDGTDVIVSLDDDNFIGDSDAIGWFLKIGDEFDVTEVSSSNNWFNCCSMLKLEGEQNIYPRGFPYSKRYKGEVYNYKDRVSRHISIRAGLWTESPDVDALTILERPARSIGLKEEFSDRDIALSDGTYCPVNTQNTAFEVDMLPLMYAVVMGDQVEGFRVDRYDDIWLGFFAKKVLDKMDRTIVFGKPLSVHKRNIHNIMKDLRNELMGMILNEAIISVLDEIGLTADNFIDCYEELIQKMRDRVMKREDIEDIYRVYFDKVFSGMGIWLDVCKKLIGVRV